ASSGVHVWASKSAFISLSASSSFRCRELNSFLQASQKPRAIGVRFTILSLRSNIPALHLLQGASTVYSFDLLPFSKPAHLHKRQASSSRNHAAKQNHQRRNS